MVGQRWVRGAGRGVIAVLAIWVVACGDSDDPEPSSKDGGSGGSGGSNPGWRAAVGEDGTFAQTFDDETWKVRQIAGVDLHAVTCVGNLSGWAVGEGGLITHTADGGVSWAAQASPTKHTLRAVHFLHDHHTPDPRLVGIAAGDAGTLLVTANAGASWTSVATATNVTLRGVTSIVSDSVLLAVGDAGTVLRSADGGDSFQARAIPQAADLTAVDADPSGKLVVTVDTQGGIWVSLDRAETFSLEHRVNGALRSASVAPDGLRALVAGNGGFALTRDPAGSWTALAVGTKHDLHAAMITYAGDRAFVSGKGGMLFKSDATFANWQPVPLQTKLTLSALEDLDPH